MTADVSYTTEEVAKLLKISKLTVYDLIKKGELASYRVGKQMRVDAADLDAYKSRSKSGQTYAPKMDQDGTPIRPQSSLNPSSRSLVITGQDVSLDILAKHIASKSSDLRPLREYVGSLDSLISMYRGEADIVSTHLLDGDTGEYNLSYIRKLLIGSSYIVVNLLSRSAGFYVQKGNPKKINHWMDLMQPDIQLSNREKGSGARVLLDEQLRLHGIPSSTLKGYESVENNHLAVAGKVASGKADVGIGIEKAAHVVGGVDYIPLIQERYDLVMLKKAENKQWLEEVIKILQSEAFQSELGSIQGYDLSQTGHVLYET
jgi:putative molybdopterin biosynthesis protein